MNNLLKKELKKSEAKTIPLLKSEMALLVGGVTSAESQDDAMWCISQQVICGLNSSKKDKGNDLNEERVSL